MLAPRPDPASVKADLLATHSTKAAQAIFRCDAPRNSGWRPGARWARRPDIELEDASHQPPPLSILGRQGQVGVAPCDLNSGPDNALSRSGQVKTSRSDDVIPLATIHRIASKIEIVAVSSEARRLGISPGMALTQTRALVPQIVVRDADPNGDAADLHALAVLLAQRWTPGVAISDSDGLMLDLSGVTHLYGGEGRMAARLVRLLHHRGFASRIAIADTFGAAWALARHARKPVTICPPGAQKQAILRLPAHMLRLSDATLALLHRVGVETIGDIAALPRAPFVRRFGKPAALRLDQALGHAAEPFDLVVPRQLIHVIQRFVEPIATAEAIDHWLACLIPQLTTRLAEAGLGVRSLMLVADRIDGHPQRMGLGFSRATRDPSHILRLVRRRIEEVEPGYGIDALHLHVRRAERLGPQPFDDTLGNSTPNLGTLIDLLANRSVRIWRAVPVESDVPERSVAHGHPLDASRNGEAARKKDDVGQLDNRMRDHPWHPSRPRPARLLHRPERLEHVVAELPDQPPRRFTWRGRTHVIVRADGPERIAGEWWRRASEREAVRDYFRVEVEGGARFWLFRRGDGERAETGDLSWYLHGQFG